MSKDTQDINLGGKLLVETGLRGINKIAKDYDHAVIYFHQDLDGVTSAIAMREYLKQYGIPTIDAIIIQYGDKEFSVPNPSLLTPHGHDQVSQKDAHSEHGSRTLPVLVDFAHGSPSFVIWTDHHDTQAGSTEGVSTSFAHDYANVGTISGLISSHDIFPANDIELIKMVDAALYKQRGITPAEIADPIFKIAREKGIEPNRIRLALATNKLLLSYKNKKNFMERIVLEAQPSFLSIYLKIKEIVGERAGLENPRERLASPEDIKQNNLNYVEQAKKMIDGLTFLDKWAIKEKKKNAQISDKQSRHIANAKVDKKKQILTFGLTKAKNDYGVLFQYGGGNMFKPGSYDRYTPFRNFPDANFLIIGWPMGLVQASCNPFNENRALKGVNLKQHADNVLDTMAGELKSDIITLERLKMVSEFGIKKRLNKQEQIALGTTSKHTFLKDRIGFRFDEFKAFYLDAGVDVTITTKSGNKFKFNPKNEKYTDQLKEIMAKNFFQLNSSEKAILRRYTVSLWDVIKAGSGGHKCITNISGLSYSEKGGPYWVWKIMGKMTTEISEAVAGEMGKPQDISWAKWNPNQ